VFAFRKLHDELAAHRAPALLLRAAGRAARDEIRHVRVTRALARRFGATPERPRIVPTPIRQLSEIAHENAVEGCVGEAFGALIGTHQSRAAADPAIRSAMRPIAADETRHAALAFAVAAWAEPRLSRAARAAVDEARRAAAARLVASASSPIDPALVTLAGLPAPARARALAAGFAAALA
jgi:hypothetical protein